MALDLERTLYFARRTLHGLVSRRRVFDYIYHAHGWGGESVSGAASSMERTQAIRAALPEVIRATGARVMLDIPCGDCHWIRQVALPVERYIGADIVEALIEGNRRQWAGPGRSFVVCDLVEDPLPEADLVLCRDCLIHLSLRLARRALENVRRSGARYLLATTFVGARNRPIVTGQWRPLDLCRAPFDLPAPEGLINEAHPEFPNKALGLWRLRRGGARKVLPLGPVVGWVERSETHQFRGRSTASVVGFASLYPPYTAHGSLRRAVWHPARGWYVLHGRAQMARARKHDQASVSWAVASKPASRRKLSHWWRLNRPQVWRSCSMRTSGTSGGCLMR